MVCHFERREKSVWYKLGSRQVLGRYFAGLNMTGLDVTVVLPNIPLLGGVRGGLLSSLRACEAVSRNKFFFLLPFFACPKNQRQRKFMTPKFSCSLDVAVALLCCQAYGVNLHCYIKRYRLIVLLQLFKTIREELYEGNAQYFGDAH